MEVSNVNLDEHGSTVCIHQKCCLRKQVVNWKGVLALRAGWPQHLTHVNCCGALTLHCFMLHPSWTDMVIMPHHL